MSSYYNELLKKANSEDRNERIVAACYLNEKDRAILLTDQDELVRAAAQYRMDNGPVGVIQFKKILRGEILKKEKPKYHGFLTGPDGLVWATTVSNIGMSCESTVVNDTMFERISNLELGSPYFYKDELRINHVGRSTIWGRLKFIICYILFGEATIKRKKTYDEKLKEMYKKLY